MKTKNSYDAVAINSKLLHHLRDAKAASTLRWSCNAYAVVAPIGFALPVAVITAMIAFFIAEMISTKLHDDEIAIINQELKTLKESYLALYESHESLLTDYNSLAKHRV